MHHGHPRLGSRALSLLFLLVLSVAFQPDRARACSCATQTREQAFKSAAAVFEGRVVEITRSKARPDGGRPRLQVTLLVVRAWKGVKSERMTVLTAGDEAACGFGFQQGESYLVYAQKGGSLPGVSLCSRTRPMAEAGEDIDAMGIGVVPVQPAATSEEKRAFTPDAAPEPRPAGCASCVVASSRSGTAAWTMGLLVALWLGVRRRRR
jgi:hypothetical protein